MKYTHLSNAVASFGTGHRGWWGFALAILLVWAMKKHVCAVHWLLFHLQWGWVALRALLLVGLWLSLVMSLLKDFGIIQTPHAWPWHQVAAGAIKWLQLHHSETWRQLFCSWPTRVLHNYLCAPSALCSLLQQMACKVASSAWSGFYSKSGKSKFR